MRVSCHQRDSPEIDVLVVEPDKVGEKGHRTITERSIEDDVEPDCHSETMSSWSTFIIVIRRPFRFSLK